MAQLEEVLRPKVAAWAMDHLGYRAETGVLDLLDIDEDQAVEQYGEDLGTKVARLVVVVDTETTEVWPASLDGPAEYATSGSVSLFDDRYGSGRRFVCSAKVNGEDLPELPPIVEWVDRIKD